MHRKPVLFLDFDRTLFDTEQFYEWLGEDRYAKILDLQAGRMAPPDFAIYLYPDTLTFLKKARTHYRLVLLTYAVNTLLQRRKLRGSGVIPLFDDVIITVKDKGIEAKSYLNSIGDPGWEHVFVDDAPTNILEMKTTNPEIRSIRIERTPLNKEDLLEGGDKADLVVKDLTELLDTLLK